MSDLVNQFKLQDMSKELNQQEFDLFIHQCIGQCQQLWFMHSLKRLLSDDLINLCTFMKQIINDRDIMEESSLDFINLPANSITNINSYLTLKEHAIFQQVTRVIYIVLNFETESVLVNECRLQHTGKQLSETEFHLFMKKCNEYYNKEWFIACFKTLESVHSITVRVMMQEIMNERINVVIDEESTLSLSLINLSNNLIGTIGSFLQQCDYIIFEHVARSLYLALNSPNMLTHINLSNHTIQSCQNINFGKYSRTEKLTVSSLYIQFLSLSNQNIVNNIIELRLVPLHSQYTNGLNANMVFDFVAKFPILEILHLDIIRLENKSEEIKSNIVIPDSVTTLEMSSLSRQGSFSTPLLSSVSLHIINLRLSYCGPIYIAALKMQFPLLRVFHAMSIMEEETDIYYIVENAPQLQTLQCDYSVSSPQEFTKLVPTLMHNLTLKTVWLCLDHTGFTYFTHSFYRLAMWKALQIKKCLSFKISINIAEFNYRISFGQFKELLSTIHSCLKILQSVMVAQELNAWLTINITGVEEQYIAHTKKEVQIMIQGFDCSRIILLYHNEPLNTT